ncbi:hypothetical protein AVEN_215635-1 [Araneus ventricosus]|uniref:Uncharacterized protein n=1 Tax=Araneus ventricosus TaxID=182803 RepID=A0A4Y2KFP4_ARAVE|nr:hypothetical protein AVEN_215635-1 [Araneus ventricosus]
MNIFFKRNLAFFRKKANNQSTRCVSVDATQTETETHKQPMNAITICRGNDENKNILKRASFPRSDWLRASAELLDLAAHSQSKVKAERVGFFPPEFLRCEWRSEG